jgi:cytochrome c-type biogenesis protein CcmH
MELGPGRGPVRPGGEAGAGDGVRNPDVNRSRQFSRRAPRGVRLAAAASAGLLLVGLLAAVASARSLDDRVYAVARQVMCPVCVGQTVAESDAAVAREMRAVIRQKLLAGEAPDRILRDFVEQFGEGILAEPPRRGISLVLYAGPAAALVAGLAIASASIRRWSRRPPAPPAPDAGDAAGAGGSGPPAPDPGELERLARELEAYDP